ncbi:MAG: short-chain dehydrogenase [Pseudomonadota bacterium]
MSENEKKLPTAEEFLFTHSLYEPVVLPGGSVDLAFEIVNFDNTVDAYCMECGTHSIFKRSSDMVTSQQITNGANWTIFRCSRTNSHRIRFATLAIRTPDNCISIQKIGQHPSLAELNLYDVKKYSQTLDKSYYKEFTKAIGLAAHGVGVGSFVYLRRIFEFLIEETHKIAAIEHSWDEAIYNRSRMGEKIDLLKTQLPNFLVANKQVYSILSKGIHELTEDECLKYFPVLKHGIEIILDAKLRKNEEDKKIAATKLAIQNIEIQINRSNTNPHAKQNS